MKVVRNKTELGVWLPKKLFSSLKEKIEEYNAKGSKPRLEFEIAAYLANLVIHIPLKAEDKYENGWVPICSAPYKNLFYFKHYMDFLVDNEFLIKHHIKHSTSSKTCQKYKLCARYNKQIIALNPISDKDFFFKGINSFKRERMAEAKKKCNHLTKWLNPELLTIDSKNALYFINKKYNSTNEINKKNKRIYIVKSIESKHWGFSRAGQDDRLHSILSSLPKDLRVFIQFDGNPLTSLDIKNSQPFIFSTILNQLINPNVNLLNNYLSSRKYKELYTSIISDKFRQTLDNQKLQSFIKEVLYGKFYEDYGDILFRELIYWEDYEKKCHLNETIEINKENKKLKRTIIIHTPFETRRKVAKHIIMKSLFSSAGSNQNIIQVFQKYYPEVYRVIQHIKKGKEKNFFPILLQNIEANCVLDYCTKNIAKKYPKMPLFTIHDSIVTTYPYKDILDEEFGKYLKLYFGLQPKLEPEPWKLNLFSACN